MARKDEILKSFLEHELLKSKYQIDNSDIPATVREALNSNIPIVKAIALVVDKLESTEAVRDNDLRNLITQYLNQSAI
jgi:hypothetical protein